MAFLQTNTNTFNCELVEDSLNARESVQESIQYCIEKDDSEGVQKQKENEVSTLNAQILEIQNKLEQLFKSQHTKEAIATDLAAKRCLIMCDKSESKVIEVTKEESLSKIDVTGLQQVSAHSKNIYIPYTFMDYFFTLVAFSRYLFQIDQNTGSI